jgi:arylsulfatase A-like enzyme
MWLSADTQASLSVLPRKAAMPSRRDFLQSAGLGAFSGCLGWAQTRKPNLIVMLASGVPDFTLTPTVRVPNLTRFAQESLQFERAYVCCPETAPSQASLITGRFPFACGVPRDGVPLPPDQTTIDKVLKDAGYQTVILGDWRLTGPPKDGPQKNGETDAAISFIKQSRQSPFFLLVAWRPANAASIDDNVGRLLAALSDQQAKNGTVALFTSDHGYGSGSLEPAVRVPVMLRFLGMTLRVPGRLEPGRRQGVLASTVDLAPTLLSLCGVSPPETMQGRDLTREQPQSVYSVGRLGTPGEWRMLVRGLDKLVVDREQKVTHLYNLGADPDEMDNRARDPGIELKRDELKALLNDWMRRTGDGFDPSGLKRRAQAGAQTFARSRYSAAPTGRKFPRPFQMEERSRDRKPTG